jgi:hypothetical protein
MQNCIEKKTIKRKITLNSLRDKTQVKGLMNYKSYERIDL